MTRTTAWTALCVDEPGQTYEDQLRDRWYDEVPDCIRHKMVDGGILYECHGGTDGSITVEGDVVLDDNDRMVCCHSDQVIQRFGENLSTHFPVRTSELIWTSVEWEDGMDMHHYILVVKVETP